MLYFLLALFEFITAKSNTHGYKFLIMTFGIFARALHTQLLAGLLLVLLGRWNINCPWEQRKADLVNNVVVLLTFLISVVNVLLSAFAPDSLLGDHGLNHHHTTGEWAAPRH